MHLAKGTFLGPYEIVDLLGAGGMAEVYRARDTRLGRIVAVKILPPGLATDKTRRLRFEREAKVISSLSHPHICALFDVGEAVLEDGPLQYLVMEHLEGETLAHRLRKGALPIEQVLRYGIEITDALDKAHRKNILHRDLKPANVMITKSGAKLLDFGLAKFAAVVAPPFAATRSGDPARETTPAKPLTTEGATPGTLPYIAPEQLQGHEPDARTDVFALGVTLYEMITGRPPFEGTTQASLIAAILEYEPPPVSRYQPLAPPALEWLVRMCLCKDRDERIQTAHDVLLELERIESDAKTAKPEVPQTRTRWLPWTLTAVAVVLAAAAVLTAWKTRNGQRRAPIVRRFSVSLPPAAPLLAAAALEKFAVSPDGSRIAYVADTEPPQIFIYSLQKLEATALPGTERALAPFFSPDGEWVGFFTTDGDVKKTSVAGGALVTLSNGRSLRGASWSPDDRIVFGEPWAPLRRMSASGGPVEAITSDAPPTNVRWPSFLPDGEHILYTMTDFTGDYESAKLAVLSLRTGKFKVLVNGATYGRYVPTGHLTYFRSGAIYALPFDARTLRTSGRPVPLIADVESYYGNGLAHYAVASDGALFYVPVRPEDAERQLVWVDRSGRVTIATAARRPYDEPRLSPDGTRAVVTIGQGATSDLWLHQIERDAWTRLTTVGRNTTGVWSPDGNDIAFSSNRNGGFKLFRMSADGSQLPKQMTGTTSWAFPLSWSPDGRDLAVVEFYRSGHSDLALYRPEKDVLAPFLRRSFSDTSAAFSPDGRWIAFQSDESGRDEIYVQRYPQGGPRSQVSDGGGTSPVWRKDGLELFYRNHKRVMAVPISFDVNLTAGKPQLLFEGDFEEAYDVAFDGRRFLMVRRAQGSPQVLINVVTGLFDDLKP